MEIQTLLASKGAKKIMIDYESGIPVGLNFLLSCPQGEIPIRLPARIENVRKILKNSAPRSIYENAEKIAWRNIKDWVDAQIALVETEMVSTQEVFLSYMIMGEKTLFENFTDGQLKLKSA